MEVGFSQPIELAWMETTAAMVSAGESPFIIRQRLDEILRHKIAVHTASKRSSRSKRISMLMRIWVEPKLQHISFRDRGLVLLKDSSPPDRIAIHYVMTMVAYPFFHGVTEHIGRLIRLQDTFMVQQLARRCKETFGQRDTVKYALTRVVRSLMDWELLMRVTKTGAYSAVVGKPVSRVEVAALLLEATLRSTGRKQAPLDSITASPALFPFKIVKWSSAAISVQQRLSIRREGYATDVLSLVPDGVEKQ